MFLLFYYNVCPNIAIINTECVSVTVKFLGATFFLTCLKTVIFSRGLMSHPTFLLAKPPDSSFCIRF